MHPNIALDDLMAFIKPKCQSIYTVIMEELSEVSYSTKTKVIFALLQGYLNGIIDSGMAYTTREKDEDKAELRRLLIPVLLQYESMFANIKRKNRKE